MLDIFGPIPHHQKVSNRHLPPAPNAPIATAKSTSYLDSKHLPNNAQLHSPAPYQQPVSRPTMSEDSRSTVDINALPPKPRAPANVMPGGTAHTAGGEKTSDAGPTYIDAVRSLGPEYYFNFHKRPCVRDSQLQGLTAGFAGGSLAAIIGSMSRLLRLALSEG